jgi:hypothetical protein
MSRAYDETYEVYNERERRAAKDHVCEACKETIRKGDIYCRVFILFNEEPEAVVRCLRCQAIHEHLRTLAPGDLWPDEKLNCGEEYREHWGHDPPPAIAELAFLSQDDMQSRRGR